MDAGANAYEMKLPSSPTFMSRNPDHLRALALNIGRAATDREEASGRTTAST